MEEREYEPGFEPSNTWIVKTIFKALFIGLIIFIYAFFILRFCTSEPDTKIIWTQKALDAKAQYGDAFKVYTQKQHIFIDEYKKITTSENDLTFERYGYNISIFDVMYIPGAEELVIFLSAFVGALASGIAPMPKESNTIKNTRFIGFSPFAMIYRTPSHSSINSARKACI